MAQGDKEQRLDCAETGKTEGTGYADVLEEINEEKQSLTLR